MSDPWFDPPPDLEPRHDWGKLELQQWWESADEDRKALYVFLLDKGKRVHKVGLDAANWAVKRTEDWFEWYELLKRIFCREIPRPRGQLSLFDITQR